MTDDELTERIERLAAARDGPLGEADLPEGHADPTAYLTDDAGEWADLEYARLLLEARGPAGPAWVALRELEEVESAVETLAAQYLRLWRLARGDVREGDDWRAAERVAARIATGEYPDRRPFDSIRAQLVTLGEPGRAPSDP